MLQDRERYCHSTRIDTAFQLKLTSHTHISPRVNVSKLLLRDFDKVASFNKALKLQAVEFAEQASKISSAEKVKYGTNGIPYAI